MDYRVPIEVANKSGVRLVREGHANQALRCLRADNR